MKLDFFRIPRYMKQFPFAHTLTMTYRVQDGTLEVRTRIDSLSDEPTRIGPRGARTTTALTLKTFAATAPQGAAAPPTVFSTCREIRGRLLATRPQ